MAGRVCQHLEAEAAAYGLPEAGALETTAPPALLVGICMRCGIALCDACLTKLDGINHCRACLVARAGEPAGAHAAAPSDRFVWVSFTFGVLALAGLAWSTLRAVLPAGAP